MQTWTTALLVLFILILTARSGVENQHSEKMELMKELEEQGISKETIEIMRKVPREKFISEDQKERAYENRPLPIGEGQTISQPYIVALMTESLNIEKGDKVLEVGTGSGYQAAILAEAGAKVYSIEIIESLAAQAMKNLDKAGYNVNLKVGDGYQGWNEHAPFDKIIITAAIDHVPPKLLEQLKTGGKIILPLGERSQVLTLITKTETGTTEEKITGVIFVPFTGEAKK